MCGYTGVGITITFDVTTGIYVFDCDNDTFPPGVYVFVIEITVGIVVTPVQFTLTIITHCDVPVLTLVSQPTTPHYYHLGEPVMTIWTYDIATIVTSSLIDHCGVPMIVFTTSSGMGLPIIFVDDRTVTGSFTISVYTDNVAYGGEFNLQFFFYYSGMPSLTVYSNVFTVVVVNVCIPPPGCITIIGCGIQPPTVTPPSIVIEIEVTVTVDVTYELPPWNCGTPGCDIQIDPICIDCDIGGGAVVVIVNNEINIHIDSCVDICTGDPSGNVVIIIVTGCLGDICTPVEVPITIYNPCLDPNYFAI
jgi:hypothetical protein